MARYQMALVLALIYLKTGLGNVIRFSSSGEVCFSTRAVMIV